MRRLDALHRPYTLSLVLGAISVVTIITALVMLLSGSGTSSGGTSSMERGLQLFVDKGCIRCHSHERVLAAVDDVSTMSGTGARGSGPGLTEYRGDPEFLREWLTDPRSVNPSTTMPDLNLEDHEIKALIAFLNESEDEG